MWRAGAKSFGYMISSWFKSALFLIVSRYRYVLSLSFQFRVLLKEQTVSKMWFLVNVCLRVPLPFGWADQPGLIPTLTRQQHTHSSCSNALQHAHRHARAPWWFWFVALSSGICPSAVRSLSGCYLLPCLLPACHLLPYPMPPPSSRMHAPWWYCCSRRARLMPAHTTTMPCTCLLPIPTTIYLPFLLPSPTLFLPVYAFLPACCVHACHFLPACLFSILCARRAAITWPSCTIYICLQHMHAFAFLCFCIFASVHCFMPCYSALL